MKGSALLSIGLGIALVGCSGSKEPQASETTVSAERKPAASAVSSLKSETLTPGVGKGAEVGETLTMLYRGTLMDGTEFDGNMGADLKPRAEKDPFALVLGMGQVIKGWDQGLVGIKKGEVRKLTIPYSLAYGEQGSGQIPPNSDLMFTVKCLYIVHKGDEMTIDTKDIKIGSGPEVKKGDKVTMHYVGTLLNGKKFDSSRDRKQAFSFKVGNAEVVPGFDKGVQGMKKGGIRSITIPPMAAYGAEPSNGLPKNAVLNFVIEVLSINGK